MAKIRLREVGFVGGVEHVAPGYALPKQFRANADVADETFGEMRVEIDVELYEGRLRARRLSVESDRDIGIGSATLRAIPVREIAFRATIQMLLRIDLTAEGPVYRQGDAGKLGDEEYAVVKRLVGYVEVEPGTLLLEGQTLELTTTLPTGEIIQEEEKRRP